MGGAAAARQDKRPNWVVGTNARLPVLAGDSRLRAVPVRLPVYGGIRPRPQGRAGSCCWSMPGTDHLRELREIIPDAETPASGRSSALDGFARQAGKACASRYASTAREAHRCKDLLAMTPHLYRASAEGRARAAALSELVLTVDARIVRYAAPPAGRRNFE